MADYTKLVPIIKHWEGGYVNDPTDRGGATNKGVTLSTYRAFYGRNKTAADLKNITDSQWSYIFKKGYWDPMGGDYINNQSIADLLADFAWGSGPGTAARHIQTLVGVNVDGKVGPKTIAAINNSNQSDLFQRLKNDRINFVNKIVASDSSQSKYVNGWKARINSFFFEYGTIMKVATLAILIGIGVWIYKKKLKSQKK